MIRFSVRSLAYRRLTEVELLPSRGKQPPMMKPRATAPAKTSPQGRSIDLQNTNFRLTKLAFWTDNSAIMMIHVAAIVEINKLTIGVQRIKVIKGSKIGGDIFPPTSDP